MALKLDVVQEDVARLRRLLKKLPEDPPPEAVHQLRTQISLVEAITPALLQGRAADSHRPLGPLLRVRKAAGKVRDADVFVGLTRLLPGDGDAKCLANLSKYLCRRRRKTVARLLATIGEKQDDCQLCLRQYSKLIGKLLKCSEATAPERQAAAVARRLSSELSNWPRTNRNDLHPYRIRVKRLRYLLQSTADGDPEFLRSLTVVKDAIGEWHDWSELATIAERTLEHGPSCPILAHIRLITRSKLKRAVSLTNDMRRTYFGSAASVPAARKREMHSLSDSSAKS